MSSSKFDPVERNVFRMDGPQAPRRKRFYSPRDVMKRKGCIGCGGAGAIAMIIAGIAAVLALI